MLPGFGRREQSASTGFYCQDNVGRATKSIRRIRMATAIARYSTSLQQMSKYFILCTLLIAFCGCTTGEKVAGLSPGMSQANVVRILGRPDGFRTEGDYIVLKYTNKLISGWSWDRADYFVILKDDQVTEYGSGEVRERNVGGAHTIFIHQF
jgi:hypothetical protein